jgi:hypothetical protein
MIDILSTKNFSINVLYTCIMTAFEKKSMSAYSTGSMERRPKPVLVIQD